MCLLRKKKRVSKVRTEENADLNLKAVCNSVYESVVAVLVSACAEACKQFLAVVELLTYMLDSEHGSYFGYCA
jgi:hypothetical protein